MFYLKILPLVVLVFGARVLPAAAQFVAELPGGATVELVAVVDLQVEPFVAWRPDGKPCALAKEWPKIRRPLRETNTHGFVFRCQKFAIGHGIDFRAPAGFTPIPRETVPEWETMSIRALPADKSVKIRVCTLDVWGPPQRFETNGSRVTIVEPAGLVGKLYDLVEQVELQQSPKPESVGVVLKGFSGKRSLDTEDGQYECLAHDRLGKAHPAGTVMPFGKNQIKFFQLPVEDTDHYTYRMRPVIKWITFDNLALKADAETAVKISVEDSELEKSQK